MVSVPTYEGFAPLARQVDELHREIALLRGTGGKWMNHKQVAQALNCSGATVDRLRAKINHRYEGRKPLFDADSVRAYIESTCVSADVATSRIKSVISR